MRPQRKLIICWNLLNCFKHIILPEDIRKNIIHENIIEGLEQRPLQ